MTLVVVVTFVVVLVLVLGLYWLVVGQEEMRETAAVRQRLRTARVPRARADGVAIVREEQPLSSIRALDLVLRRLSFLTRPLQQSILQADAKINVGTFLLASLVLGTGTWALFSWYTKLRGAGLLLGLGTAAIPFLLLRNRAAKRIAVFEEQFPEAIELISRALRAGHAFTTGLAMVAEEAPQPVAGEFRTLYDQQNFGMPMPDALRAFAARIPLLDARFFATAVLTQRESGGNLAEILDNLGSVIRDRFKVKRQVRIHTAHARATGWVLSALPPALGLALFILNPERMKPMFTDPFGVRLIVGALVLQIVGTIAIRRIVDIEY
jgi:tight adherence protein B